MRVAAAAAARPAARPALARTTVLPVGRGAVARFWTWAEIEEAEEAEAIFAEACVGGMWFFGLCVGNGAAYIIAF